MLWQQLVRRYTWYLVCACELAEIRRAEEDSKGVCARSVSVGEAHHKCGLRAAALSVLLGLCALWARWCCCPRLRSTCVWKESGGVYLLDIQLLGEGLARMLEALAIHIGLQH